MRDWQAVYSDDQEHRVDIVQAVLSDKGMSPVKINKQVSQHGFGNFEIFVAPDYVIRAIRIIKEEIKFE
ncbi:hypothetical protein [Ekhidna sp.]|uniref:hypothetical protein n=1 Tax=Ekhidna sp. TaxID=2608089 RepID=UPI003B5BFE9D